MQNATQKLTAWQQTALQQPEFEFVQKLIANFPEANVYLVGGAVRDIIIDRQTKDYDFVVTKVAAADLEAFLATLGDTNLVGKSFGVFKFKPTDYEGEAFDIALPRTEVAGMSGGYTDFEIQSDKDLPIEADLGRRDFTINALAWDVAAKNLIDVYDGLHDLEQRVIRAIGNPAERFQEDYTRMLRAIRFSCQLGCAIDNDTAAAIATKADAISEMSIERINDEFTKIILSDRAGEGIRLLHVLGLLKPLIPELEDSIGVGQNKAHIYDVFEHLVRALDVAVERSYSLEIRLAALFHDIGKPDTKEGNGIESTFYNHDIVGAKMTKTILKRLNYSNDIITKVVHLVRYHMFYYALDSVTDAGVRRLLNRLGKDHIEDFIAVRICDRLGMGRPKAKPWKLLQLERRLKEVQLEPITPKMLALRGDELMPLLKLTPGPRVGMILNALLGEVLEDPGRNTREYLENRAHELNQLDEEALKALHPDIIAYEEERKRLLHQNEPTKKD